MTKEISTSIRIQARPEQVWKTFTAFDRYPEWNPFVVSITGDVKPGNTIRVDLRPPGGKGMIFKPRVLQFEPNRTFRWKGRLLMPGIFDGEHIFELVDNGDGSTTFIQRELFFGILVPFLRSMLDNQTKAGFEEMNKRLKAECER